jgi:hypothetical protein
MKGHAEERRAARGPARSAGVIALVASSVLFGIAHAYQVRR